MTLLLLLGALLAVLASGFFSGAEMGVYCLNSVRLRVLSERGNRAARLLLPLMERYEGLVASTLVGTNIADYLASALVTAAMWRGQAGASAGAAELYATLIVTPLILVFGNIVPKERFRRDTDRLMYACAPLLAPWTKLVEWTGLSYALQRLTRALLRWFDADNAGGERDLLPRARMRRMLREGAERGGLTMFQQDAFERVMQLSRMRVTRVMTPRQRMACVPKGVSRENFLRIAQMAHFSRLLAYQANARRVVGFIDVFDVFTDDQQRPPADHVRDVLRLRTTDTVPTALRALQQAHQALAIVVDERDECLGVLTVKDLVEEIVGDLEAW